MRLETDHTYRAGVDLPFIANHADLKEALEKAGFAVIEVRKREPSDGDPSRGEDWDTFARATWIRVSDDVPLPGPVKWIQDETSGAPAEPRSPAAASPAPGPEAPPEGPPEVTPGGPAPSSSSSASSASSDGIAFLVTTALGVAVVLGAARRRGHR